jgi:RNA 2',3'-cyclic 3'-phosphodiesterase
MRTIRSFIAVNIGVAIVRAVADEQSRLRRAVSARGGVEVRWVAPQNLHVTLSFLGQVTEPMVAAIEDGLEPVARRFSPFEITARGLGVFPDARHPRVVWVGLGDAGESLVRLHAAIAEVLGRMGFDLEDKPFRSHVTIGRVKGGDGEALAACLAEAGEKTYGSFTVRDIACYRSDLRPTGADYVMLWRLPLGGRPRVTRPSGTAPAAEPEQTAEPEPMVEPAEEPESGDEQPFSDPGDDLTGADADGDASETKE